MIKRMDEEAKASFEEMYLTYQDTLRRLAYAYDIPVDDIAILDEVDRMPENWQKVAELKLIEGRPTSEVCDQLSISEKACYSRVSRIRKYIKSLLKREDWP